MAGPDSPIIKREYSPVLPPSPSLSPPFLPLPRPADYHAPTVPFVNPFATDFTSFWPSAEISPKTKFAPLPYISSYCRSSLASGPHAQSSALFDSTSLSGFTSQLPALDSPPDSYSPFISVLEPQREQRIPRPPNAFMLFRSSLVKTGCVPADAEKRQQNISRMAGEIWRMLPQSERDKWQEKAAQKSAEHQRLYPNYKFQPSPRKSKKVKVVSNEAGSKEYIRKIREKYTGFVGPAPPKLKRRRRTRAPSDKDIGLFDVPPPLPSTLRSVANTTTASYLPSHSRRPSMAQIMYERRPSTSLGFKPSLGLNTSPDPVGVRSSSADFPEIGYSSFFVDLGFSNQSFDNFDQLLPTTSVQPPCPSFPDLVAPAPMLSFSAQQSTLFQSYGQGAQQATPPIAVPSLPQSATLDQNTYATSEVASETTLDISFYSLLQPLPVPLNYNYDTSLLMTPSVGWPTWDNAVPTGISTM